MLNCLDCVTVGTKCKGLRQARSEALELFLMLLLLLGARSEVLELFLMLLLVLLYCTVGQKC